MACVRSHGEPVVHAEHDHGDVNGGAGGHFVHFGQEAALLRAEQPVAGAGHVGNLKRSLALERVLKPGRETRAEPVADHADPVAVSLGKWCDVAGRGGDGLRMGAAQAAEQEKTAGRSTSRPAPAGFPATP